MENAGAAADCNTFSWNDSETNGDWFVTREYTLRHLVDIISVTKTSGDRRVGRFGFSSLVILSAVNSIKRKNWPDPSKIQIFRILEYVYPTMV